MYCAASPFGPVSPREAGVASSPCCRLRDRDQLDGPERPDDLPGGAAVGDAETHDDRLGDREIFRGEERQSETAHGVLHLRDRVGGGDVHHHLVLDQARQRQRWNVDDPALEAGRQVAGGRSPQPRL